MGVDDDRRRIAVKGDVMSIRTVLLFLGGGLLYRALTNVREAKLAMQDPPEQTAVWVLGFALIVLWAYLNSRHEEAIRCGLEANRRDTNPAAGGESSSTVKGR